MADSAAMKRFASGKPETEDEELEGEDPMEDMGDEEEDQPESTGRSQEELDEIVELVRENLQKIEESVSALSDEELFELDEELPEETADAITAALGELPEEIGDELYNIDEADAQYVAEGVEEDLEVVDVEQLAAFLYQAGKLVTPGTSARSGDISPVK